MGPTLFLIEKARTPHLRRRGTTDGSRKWIFRFLLSFIVGRLVVVLPSSAQAANPIAPSRLPDGNASIPNPSWAAAGATIVHRTTQCGSTLAPGSTVATVNNAIQNCPAGQFVSLAAGHFTFSASLQLKSNVTVRGAGSNATFITFTGAGGGSGCSRGANVCFAGSFVDMGSPQNVINWTAGYSKGTSVITVQSASGLSVGRVIHLDELSDNPNNDAYPEAWRCTMAPTCSYGPGSGESNGGGVRNGRAHQHEAYVTAINGNQVTIQPPLFSSFQASRNPQIIFADGTGEGSGLEDMSLDSNDTSAYMFEFTSVRNSWVARVRSINPGRSHMAMDVSVNNTVRDSYFFRTANHEATSYGLEMISGGSNRIENNIFQWITAPMVNNGGSGNVWSYNFAVNDEFTQPPGGTSYMFAGGWVHNGGAEYTLFEGNDMPGVNFDIEHGSQHLMTVHRNYLWGRERAPAAVNATIPVNISQLNRFMNFTGNVLGVSGYHTTYECDTVSCTSENTSIYKLGNEIYSPADGPPVDPKTKNSSLRWGNWDVVTGLRWDTSEIPSGIGGSYANPVPASQSVPTSYYLAAKPAFFKSSDAWPPIGPDVSGGSIANVGGHVSPIPARQCYLNLMGGSLTGTTVLPFDAVVCYGASGTTPPASACDLNNDGSTNVSDVQIAANQAIGAAACAAGDINTDSACNVIDVQRVVNGALGGPCVTQ
jgi:hypothetical protein